MLHPQVALFAAKLREIEEILSEDTKTRWTEEIKRCRIAAEKSDGWCVDRFLSYFGGMGSLNDYYVQKGDKPDVIATDKLQVLLSEAWTLARTLQRTE